MSKSRLRLVKYFGDPGQGIEQAMPFDCLIQFPDEQLAFHTLQPSWGALCLITLLNNSLLMKKTSWLDSNVVTVLEGWMSKFFIFGACGLDSIPILLLPLVKLSHFSIPRRRCLFSLAQSSQCLLFNFRWEGHIQWDYWTFDSSCCSGKKQSRIQTTYPLHCNVSAQCHPLVALHPSDHL